MCVMMMIVIELYKIADRRLKLPLIGSARNYSIKPGNSDVRLECFGGGER